jgi:ribosome-binding protein aMBF1 (putative translation factor)
MANQEEETLTYCESCNRESKHLVKYVDPDNSVHYVCWRCVQRTEKRVNLKETWKRRGKR